MLEILVIGWVSGVFAKRAVAKGRPSWQGRAPIIIGWVGGEILGFIVGLGGASEQSEVYVTALGFAIVGLVIGIVTVLALPAGQGAAAAPAAFVPQPMAPSPTPQPPTPGFTVPPTVANAGPQAQATSTAGRRAGFCSECGANVWLDDAGCCQHGHSADKITNAYAT